VCEWHISLLQALAELIYERGHVCSSHGSAAAAKLWPSSRQLVVVRVREEPLKYTPQLTKREESISKESTTHTPSKAQHTTL